MRAEAGQKQIIAESLLVEEGGSFQVHRLVELLVEVLVEAIDLDSEFLQKSEGFFAVVMGSLQRLRSAISNQQTLGGLELIAFGMAAEIVVIVENQNLRV